MGKFHRTTINLGNRIHVFSIPKQLLYIVISTQSIIGSGWYE